MVASLDTIITIFIIPLMESLLTLSQLDRQLGIVTDQQLKQFLLLVQLLFGETMNIYITERGCICYNNKQGRLHSFNGKPAVIWPLGGLEWYDDGMPIKTITSNGYIRCFDKFGRVVSTSEWPGE